MTLPSTTMNRHLQRTLLAAALLPALALIAADAAAQAQPPGIGEALRQVPPPKAPAQAEPALPQIGNLPALPPPLQHPAGAKIAVKQFDISGNDSLPADELLALVRQGEGQSLTLAELEALAARITQHYRGRGYFVARAYLPAQEVSGGNITIRVVEGRYGKFVLENASLVNDQTVQAMLDAAKGSGVVTVRSLERAMLNINDTPGAVVTRADVMPGEQVGSSDFHISTAAAARASGYATLDNYGSAYTGKRRLTGGVDINSPFGLGDRLSASGMLTEGQYLKNYRLAYSTLLAAGGLRGEIAASRTAYQLSDTYASLDAVGTARSVEASLSYPLIRTQAYTLEGGLSAGHRKLRDELRASGSATPKQADVLSATLSSRAEDALWGMPARTTAQASVSLGRLRFDDAGARQQDALGAATEGRYGRVNLSLSRATQLQRSWTLNTGLRMQHALFDKNLDGSEDMSISGQAGVRAYASGELAAENAALLNVELQYSLPVGEPASAKVGLFGDAGRASMQNALGGSGARSLSDVGVGLYLGHQRLFATLQIAKRTGGAPTSESVASTRALLQMGGAF